MGAISISTGESLYVATGGDNLQPSAISSSEQSSLAAMFERRQWFHYRWANAAARTAQTGMLQGSYGLQVDTDTEYRFAGGAWRISVLPATAFTPSWTNLTLGTSTVSADYEIAGSVCKGKARVLLASGFSISGSILMNLPVTAAAILDGRPIGSATYIDAGLGYYRGTLLMNASGQARLMYEPTAFLGPINATSPFTWVATDEIIIDFLYQAAI
jgi:hypothetical protein